MKKSLFLGGLTVLLAANLAVGLWLFSTFSMYYPTKLTALKNYLFPSKVKIFVTYYKPYLLPERGDILVPIQVGRAIENSPFMGGQLSDDDKAWLNRNMIGDDTGDNISVKNREYDVLTAYYWVWKHYNEIGNPKYIGFFAHRKRLMIAGENQERADFWKPDYGYKGRRLLELMEKHKVIATLWNPWAIEKNNFYDSYRQNHHGEDIDVMIEVIKEKYPELMDAMNAVLYDENTDYAVFNFWIMEKELAFEFFEILFDVMKEVEKKRHDAIVSYDLTQRRAYGYLAERFYAIWLLHQMRTKGISPKFVGVEYF